MFGSCATFYFTITNSLTSSPPARPPSLPTADGCGELRGGDPDVLDCEDGGDEVRGGQPHHAGCEEQCAQVTHAAGGSVTVVV